MVGTQTKNQNIFWLWSNAIDFQKRGDVDYWSPCYDFLHKLKGCPIFAQFITDICYGTSDKLQYYGGGVPFLRVTDIDKSDEVLWSNEKYISKNVAQKYKNERVNNGDIIISRTGTLGIAIPITKRFSGAVFGSYFIKINFSRVNQLYLSTFINSIYGRKQFEKASSGAIQTNITIDDIKNLRIFIPPLNNQQKVERIVKEAFHLKKEAEKEYKEAVNCLNKELKSYYDLSLEKRTFVKWSDEINFIEKLHPIAYKKPDKRECKQFIKIKDYANDLSYGTSEDLEYKNEGVPFLRVTDIDEHFQIDTKNLKYISQFNANRLSSYKVNADELLISRTGTLGSTILIDKKLGNSIFGSYFIKVRFNDELKKILDFDCLAFFINSKIGKLQTASLSSGGIQTNLTVSAIENMEIPIINKVVQAKIINLLHSFKQKMIKSQSLLEEAKDFVKTLIEKTNHD